LNQSHAKEKNSTPSPLGGGEVEITPSSSSQ
jgi:hypothetical protein